MILCLTDDQAIVRALTRHANETERTAAVHLLPKRLTSAAALVGTLVERVAPRIVVVATPLRDDPHAAVGVVYRVLVAGEAWIPDVPLDHTFPALSVAASGSPPPEAPAVSVAAAAAAAAAIAVLDPQRVVFVAGGSTAADLVAAAALDLGVRLAAHGRAADRRSGGPDHVAEALRLGGELADRLRLTATQRARFLGDVRSASVRGGELPTPLREAAPAAARTKEEAKRRLAELELRLREWRRAEA